MERISPCPLHLEEVNRTYFRNPVVFMLQTQKMVKVQISILKSTFLRGIPRIRPSSLFPRNVTSKFYGMKHKNTDYHAGCAER